MKCSLVLLPLVSVLATSAGAQTAVDRALQSGGAVGGPEHLMNEGSIGNIVLPYETPTPSEGGMSHVQFEDRINEVRERDDAQGRSLRATEDGYRVRPEVDIDGQGPLFDDANWAHEHADDVAGHYFTSETGSCEPVSLPVTNIVDQFCSSAPAEQSETCDLVRRIWVDRWDTYRCDQRADQFIEVCEREAQFACHQAAGQTNCLHENIRFEGGIVSWDGDLARVHFPAPPSGQPLLALHEFTISISDHFAPEEIRMVHIEVGGIAQLTTRNPDGTGLRVLETFMNGGGNGIGSGGVCPYSVDTGLIVPTYFSARGSECPRPDPASMVGIYGDLVQAGIDVYSRAYSTGYTVSTSGEHGFACYRLPVPECSRFQNISGARLNRNLVRWVDVPVPTHPIPGAQKQWGATTLTLRVVAPRPSQYATLTFRFIGACCDSFINVGAEQCE